MPSGREPVFLLQGKTHFYLLQQIESYQQSTPTRNCTAYRPNLTRNGQLSGLPTFEETEEPTYLEREAHYYQERKGLQFTSYVPIWIAQAIQRKEITKSLLQRKEGTGEIGHLCRMTQRNRTNGRTESQTGQERPYWGTKKALPEAIITKKKAVSSTSAQGRYHPYSHKQKNYPGGNS